MSEVDEKQKIKLQQPKQVVRGNVGGPVGGQFQLGVRQGENIGEGNTCVITCGLGGCPGIATVGRVWRNS